MGFNIGNALGGLVKGFFGGSKLGDALGGAVKDLFNGAGTDKIFSNLAKIFLDSSDIKATGDKAGSTSDTVASMVSAFGKDKSSGSTAGEMLKLAAKAYGEYSKSEAAK